MLGEEANGLKGGHNGEKPHKAEEQHWPFKFPKERLKKTRFGNNVVWGVSHFVLRTHHLIIATFAASFTPRHATTE